MSCQEVFKFAVRILGASAEAALAKAGLDIDDIDLLIPHQANRRIIETAISRLEVPPEKVYINLDRYGNTSSASIPIALDEVVRLGKLREHDLGRYRYALVILVIVHDPLSNVTANDIHIIAGSPETGQIPCQSG